MDTTRVNSVLNQPGAEFSYKCDSHKYTYTVIQQQDWQMKLNSKRRTIKPIENDKDPKDWEQIISHPNSHIHETYRNIALTFMHEVNVENGP